MTQDCNSSDERELDDSGDEAEIIVDALRRVPEARPHPNANLSPPVRAGSPARQTHSPCQPPFLCTHTHPRPRLPWSDRPRQACCLTANDPASTPACGDRDSAVCAHQLQKVTQSFRRQLDAADATASDPAGLCCEGLRPARGQLANFPVAAVLAYIEHSSTCATTPDPGLC
jgi:hypothetical protein